MAFGIFQPFPDRQRGNVETNMPKINNNNNNVNINDQNFNVQSEGMANMGRGKQSDESFFPDVVLCAAGRFMSENFHMSEKKRDSKISVENIYSFLQSMMFRSFAGQTLI